MRTRVPTIIDLDRYPIDRLDRPEGAELVESCRAALRARGACQLPGFLRPDAVARLVAEATAARQTAHRTDATHTVYFEEARSPLDPADPHTLLQHSSKEAIGWDLVAPDSDLRAVYEWDAVTEFLARVLDLPRLHRYTDPVGAASLMLFGDGDELGWHFDRSPFAVTIMLRPAADGGVYEYHHDLRGPGDENAAGVVAALRGERDDRIVLPNEAGTLSLFRGQHSLHRVTPVQGDVTRINAVLAYSTTPDDELNPLTRELFYGSRS